MLDLIKHFFNTPEYPLMDALILLGIAALIALLTHLLITWTLLLRAQKKQRPKTTYIFKEIRLPISVTIFFIGIYNALSVLIQDPSHQIYTPLIMQNIAIIVWGQFAYRSTQFGLKNLSQSVRKGALIRPQTLPLFSNIAAIIVVLIIFYLLFITWNMDMSAWLASAGIIGIVIGFAAKDSMANLLSGVFILADSPYKIGDYIVIDSGERGMVTDIGLRSTRILTLDDLEVNIPNSVIANGKIINESSGRHLKSRTGIAVRVSYNSDIDQVKKILLDIASKEPLACSDPKPIARCRQFGTSGMDMQLLVWIDRPERRGGVIDNLNTATFKRFAAEGIEIAIDKRDLYVKSLPEA